MIELGLARISRLVKHISMPWRAIHVAGTNGKGSVCAYASAMLKAGNVRCGRFTSPHLIDRWDCITINDQVVDPRLFHWVEDTVRSWDKQDSIGASEFELLTATAFEIFTREKVEVAVVEVGLGGRHDATNVLQNPLVTVITKIGMDHESILGDSLEAIAHQKAGIMKPGVHCFVDSTNVPSVINVLRENAKRSKALSITLVPEDIPLEDQTSLLAVPSSEQLEQHQRTNLLIAYEATKSAMKSMERPMNAGSLAAALETSWPGRLQMIDLSKIVGSERSALLDGAHNASSAEVLASFVDRKSRACGGPVTWILAFSQGKNLRELLATLLRSGDNLIAAEFGPVEGMPWVHPAPCSEVLTAAEDLSIPLRRLVAPGEPLEEICRLASKAAGGHPIVVAGSLYLVSDLLRLLRNKI